MARFLVICPPVALTSWQETASEVTVITVDHSLPPVAQAAFALLALVLLRKVGTGDMGEFGRHVLTSGKRTITNLGRIVLTEQQQLLLADHARACALVSPGPPRRTIAVSSGCDQYPVVAGSVPSGCADAGMRGNLHEGGTGQGRAGRRRNSNCLGPDAAGRVARRTGGRCGRGAFRFLKSSGWLLVMRPRRMMTTCSHGGVV